MTPLMPPRSGAASPSRVKPNRIALAGVMCSALAATCLAFVAGWENGPKGPALTPYRDVGGVWTQCSGETLNVTAASSRETPEGCAIRLDRRLAGYARQVAARTPALRGHSRYDRAEYRQVLDRVFRASVAPSRSNVAIGIARDDADVTGLPAGNTWAIASIDETAGTAGYYTNGSGGNQPILSSDLNLGSGRVGVLVDTAMAGGSSGKISFYFGNECIDPFDFQGGISWLIQRMFILGASDSDKFTIVPTSNKPIGTLDWKQA